MMLENLQDEVDVDSANGYFKEKKEVKQKEVDIFDFKDDEDDVTFEPDDFFEI